MKTEDAEFSVGKPVERTQPELVTKNCKILIATDDRAMARGLLEILRPAGYVVREVDSGEKALDFIPEFEPDLALLDVELPGVHVFEICRLHKIRQGGAAPEVIFISSKSDPSEVVEGLAAGGVDHMFSPFGEQEVLARIRVHLLNRLRLTQLRKNDRAKTRLLSTAVHDLRNPLVSIRTLTHLMRKGSLGTVTARQSDVLDTVYDASQSMLDLVNELLEVSVMEAGESKIVPRRTSLADLVAAAIRLNNATASEKGSVIEFDPGPRLPELALDKPKVWQVLNNLLGNAIKFSPPGSLITVAGELTLDECAVLIRDKGPGIPEAERALLFKDFGLTSVKPTSGEPSIGLGLSICRKVMEGHKGTISARNLPGGGAEFRIAFPIGA